MDGPPAPRLVHTVLRCYPARWRRRHGDEAAELAALLIRDGTPPAAVAGSYLAGAGREWLTPRPGRRVSAVACALLVAAGALGVSTGLLASAGPARAASTSRASTSRASTSRASAHCRPGAPATVPALTPDRGRPRLIIPAAAHDRSC
jgi:hypothetical protein